MNTASRSHVARISRQNATAFQVRVTNLPGSLSAVAGRLPLRCHTPEEKKRDWKQFFEPAVVVYDTRARQFTETDPLLDATSYPMAAVEGDTIYAQGGEGGKRLWQPATFHIGRIQP